jgi:hypothetical protein
MFMPVFDEIKKVIQIKKEKIRLFILPSDRAFIGMHRTDCFSFGALLMVVGRLNFEGRPSASMWSFII